MNWYRLCILPFILAFASMGINPPPTTVRWSTLLCATLSVFCQLQMQRYDKNIKYRPYHRQNSTKYRPYCFKLRIENWELKSENNSTTLYSEKWKVKSENNSTTLYGEKWKVKSEKWKFIYNTLLWKVKCVMSLLDEGLGVPRHTILLTLH